MKKIVSILFAFILLGCSYNNVQNKDIDYTISSEEIQTHINLKEYIKFKTELGFKESSNRYHITNKDGTYVGKYQFGRRALKDINMVYPKDKFINSIHLQEKALFKYLLINQKYLDYEIRHFIGQTINGVKITKSGLLASAHLVGHRGVKRFLHSHGNIVPKDGNGTSVIDYLQHFSGYNFDLNNEVAYYVTNRKEESIRYY